jgi:glycosyltransferase involved in cell wall biosynthesis
MTDLAKMTVVTPVWNLFEAGRVESFRQMMESVHCQTYKNIEHIIINNNSTDSTQELIDEYIKKGRCSCHFHPIQGLWHAMQKGLEVASGEYINFMNSDDFFCDDKAIEIAANELITNNADMFYSGSNRIHKDGTIGYWWAEVGDFYVGGCPNHQSVWVRVKDALEFGGFDFNYKLSLDDHMMRTFLFNNKKIVSVNKPFVSFRDGGWTSVQDGKEFALDYANHFYDKMGKSWGLTFEECMEIRGFGLFQERSKGYCLALADKIQNQNFRLYYLERLEEFFSNKSVGYFFGFIPLFTAKVNLTGTKVKYYLFGFIPIYKIKRSY